MAYWLMKTEPEEFSYADLESRGREPWNGVRNPTALKHMRAMAPGDLFLFYHTGNERAVVGVGRVERAAYPDPAESDPRFVVVDVVPAYRFAEPVTLAAIKADERFAAWELVRQSRLSVMPVPEELWRVIHTMGKME
ncbi:MAG TPA: EVE domain-containing protein [Symbiobacteriaceae bacterium]|nr:EVE domain-containing protein [Symbiobacteriaceae bacterium]